MWAPWRRSTSPRSTPWPDSLSGVSNVYAMAIPLSSSITLPDSLLSDIPGSDQAQAEKDILAGMGQNIKTVPLHDALNAHRTEYIYFRTDHHWDGAGRLLRLCTVLQCQGHYAPRPQRL